MTTLSVIMPNYNDAEHITSALTAICEQSLPPYEVLVVDDGSTDNSLSVIEDTAKRYPVIKLIRNENNEGVNFSVNKATKMVTGDYVYYASASDLVLPGLFERSMDILSRYPEAGFCCTDCKVINVPDGTEYQLRANWAAQPMYLSSGDLAKQIRKAEVSHPWGNTCILRRDALPQGEIFISDLEWHGDWFLYALIAARHGCCYIPEVLAAWKWFGKSYWYAGTNDPKSYHKVFARIIQHLALPENEETAQFVVQGRGLQFVKPSVRTPLAVIKALESMPQRNNHSAALLRYLTLEYIKDVPRALCNKLSNGFFKPAYYLFDTASGYLHNLCDRIYARSFHEYAKVRSLVIKDRH